jgi:hypothetical protein
MATPTPGLTPEPTNRFSDPDAWRRLLSGLGLALSSRARGGTLSEGFGAGAANFDQQQRQRQQDERQARRDQLDEEEIARRQAEEARKAESAKRIQSLLMPQEIEGLPVRQIGGVPGRMAGRAPQPAGNDPLAGLNLSPVTRKLLAQAAMDDPDGALGQLLELSTKEQEAPDAPTVKDFYEGGKVIQKQWDGTQWVKVGEGARWQPDQGQGLTERQRNAQAAGLQPGTPEYTQFILGKDDTAPGPFQGTGLDAQSYNMVLTGDPTKPEYAAAYAQLAMPKVQFDAVTGKSVIVQPDMSWARKPASQVAATPAPDGATTQSVPGAQITSNQGAPVYNEGQGKAAGFADRMTQANGSFDEFQAAGMDRVEGWKGEVPIFGNSLISSDRQQFEQAERNFINAQLRRESGAVISPEEFKEARKQYIPQPGDDAGVLAQKKESRRIAIEAMQREGGPFYKPGSGKKTVIDGYEIEELP